jgi:hypothetical protein
MKQPSKSHVFEWVKISWKSVIHKTIAKSFKKCDITNALDSVEGDEMFEESENSSNNNSNDESDSSD